MVFKLIFSTVFHDQDSKAKKKEKEAVRFTMTHLIGNYINVYELDSYRKYYIYRLTSAQVRTWFIKRSAVITYLKFDGVSNVVRRSKYIYIYL